MMRDITAAAKRLIDADAYELEVIVHHDADMIRDVAAALLYERDRKSVEQKIERVWPHTNADDWCGEFQKREAD